MQELLSSTIAKLESSVQQHILLHLELITRTRFTKGVVRDEGEMWERGIEGTGSRGIRVFTGVFISPSKASSK